MANILETIDGYRGRSPVPVFDILTDLGLKLEFRPLDDDTSGWIERFENNSYQVVVNSNHPIVRQRFTAAHELAHFVYHKDLLGRGTGDTRAYRAEGSPIPNARIRPKHERQANSFAANLLMPEYLINDWQKEGAKDLEELAEKLEVSFDALKIRIG